MTSPQLVGRVSCVVCMEHYDGTSHVPKLLPCQHTFCAVCISSITNKNVFPFALHCPTCRRHHVIPPEGFITNRAVLDIADELNNTTRLAASALKCTKHANKEAVLVCIDCLEALCVTCVRASSHSHKQHRIEDLDVAKTILQKKIIDSKSEKLSVLDEKLSLLKESPCSCAEMAKADADIKSMADKLHAKINKWENEEHSKVQNIKTSAQEQERETDKEKDTIHKQDLDLTTLLRLCKIQHTKHGDDENDDDEFMNKLQLRETKGDELCRCDERLVTLLDGMQLEIKSKSSIHSKLLKKDGITSASHQFNLLKRRANNVSEIPSFGRISDLSNAVDLLLVNVIVMAVVFIASFCFIISTIGLSSIHNDLNHICRYVRPTYETTEGFFCAITVDRVLDKKNPHFDFYIFNHEYGYLYTRYNRSQTQIFCYVLLLYIAVTGASVAMQIICRSILTLSIREVTFLSRLAYCCKFFFVTLGIYSSPALYLAIVAHKPHERLISRLLFVSIIAACIIQWYSTGRMRKFIYQHQPVTSPYSFRFRESNIHQTLIGGVCGYGNKWKLLLLTIAAPIARYHRRELALFVHGDLIGSAFVIIIYIIYVFILQLVSL